MTVPAAIDEFRVLRVASAGATAWAYAALDRNQRAVVLRVARATSRRPFAVLLAEVRALAALRGEGLETVLGAGLWEHRPYLVCAPPVGVSLAERTTPLAPDELESATLSLARGLARLHGAGLGHGDVQPAHVTVGARGEALLLGVAVEALLGRTGWSALLAARDVRGLATVLLDAADGNSRARLSLVRVLHAARRGDPAFPHGEALLEGVSAALGVTAPSRGGEGMASLPASGVFRCARGDALDGTGERGTREAGEESGETALHLEERLAACPNLATVKGIFLRDVALLRQRSGGGAAARFVPSRDYPLREWLELLVEGALLAYPALGPREAVRRLGRRAYPLLLETLPGRVLFSLAGPRPESALPLFRRALRLMQSEGECSVSLGAAGEATVRLRGVLDFPDSYYRGLFEGFLGAQGVVYAVDARPVGTAGADLTLRWRGSLRRTLPDDAAPRAFPAAGQRPGP